MKVNIVGCREHTITLIESIPPELIGKIITISPYVALVNHVSGYSFLNRRFENNVLQLDAYKLDQSKITPADVCFCIGWNRLLPNWFLKLHTYGVFGMHSCENMLPNGKGRSPMVWSLINGAKKLYCHVIRYDDSVDGGDVCKIFELPITDADDINTLQHRTTYLFTTFVNEALNDLNSIHPIELSGPEFFYPKRTEEDGAIDWRWTGEKIFNWVRAQTRPYPGAFTTLNGNKIKIWKCSRTMIKPGVFGEVEVVFPDGTFLISCSDELIHVTDYSCDTTVGKGDWLQ